MKFAFRFFEALLKLQFHLRIANKQLKNYRLSSACFQMTHPVPFLNFKRTFTLTADFFTEMDSDLTNKELEEQSLTSSSTNGFQENTPHPHQHGFRRIICICIIISGMLFNGFVYGYSSPALPSFRKDLELRNDLDHVLKK